MIETWALVDVHADVQPDGDRWLLIYNVPAAYASDGTYSVSYPAGMINDWAATYGYDLDDPAEVDALWDHLIYAPYIAEVARLEGRAHEAARNPFEMTADAAREMARDQLRQFKKTRTITTASALAVAGRAARASGTLLDRIRADMVGRVDSAAVRAADEHATWARTVAQERMVTLAYRMNEARSAAGG
ncbi:hypothetical protein [Streptosporangium longisporum]|uniref:Uncharacterized protein n=1 Tax=Streptosporangium longisporum TaxID=46187 RepID=A0ABP6L1R2_9ACTN